MAEDPAQHDSGDEWLVELLSLPSSSLTRRQTATAVSSAGEAASAPGSAAHAAAGSSAGALPAAVSVEDHCIAARELMQRHVSFHVSTSVSSSTLEGALERVQGRLHQRAEERPSTSSSKVHQRPRLYHQSPNSAASVSMAARSAASVLPLLAPNGL